MDCDHLDAAARRPSAVLPSSRGCVECLATGGRWVHLRLCLTCGHVGCCNDSPNRHATHHHHETGHPVVRSYEPGEAWAYCYVHGRLVGSFPALPGEAAPLHYGPTLR